MLPYFTIILLSRLCQLAPFSPFGQCCMSWADIRACYIPIEILAIHSMYPTQISVYLNWLCNTKLDVKFSTWWDGRLVWWWFPPLFKCCYHIMAMAISLVRSFHVILLHNTLAFVLDIESAKHQNPICHDYQFVSQGDCWAHIITSKP